MKINIHPENPQPRLIKQVVDILNNDGVIVYPTDTSFAFGCSIFSKKALERIHRLKKIDKKNPLTFIGSDFSQIQNYITDLSSTHFRIIKKCIPVSITFIFTASKKMPRTMQSPRKTIGVRIPLAPIATSLCRELESPILSSSVRIDPEHEDDPYIHGDRLEKQYGNRVDAVIECGPVLKKTSALIDYTQSSPKILREGDANLSHFSVR